MLQQARKNCADTIYVSAVAATSASAAPGCVTTSYRPIAVARAPVGVSLWRVPVPPQDFSFRAKHSQRPQQPKAPKPCMGVAEN